MKFRLTEVHSERLETWQSRSVDRFTQCRQIYDNKTNSK